MLERASKRVGTIIKEKWRLDAIIGIGGMATVYAATHQRNRKRVAIKMLHPELSADALVTTRFTREGYMANTVRHPGAVSVIDDDTTEDGASFLVMELLEGETVDSLWARSGTLTPGDVLAITNQLLDVLAAAHAKGILHRDLKPENLFLTKDGQLKVLDFGIARLRELTAGQDAGATCAGSLLGTPAFMAPEQARAHWQEVDERTDLWAVGATMYSLLSARFVHEAETVTEQLVLSATTAAESVAKVCPNLPQSVVEIVDRALAYERSDRWPDAHAFQEAVQGAMLLYPGGSAIARPRYPSHVSIDGMTAPSYPRISSMGSRPSALTTGRPFVSEVDSLAPRKSSRLWTVMGALVLVLTALGLFATRSSDAPAVVATRGLADPVPEAPPSAHPAAVTEPAAPVSENVAAEANVEPLSVTDVTDKSAHEPSKSAKSGTKIPANVPRRLPESQKATGSPPAAPTSSRASADPFDKRY